MAIIKNSTITADGDTVVPVKNSKNGSPQRFTIACYGDFGSGTITLTLSPDKGTTKIADIDDSATVSFTDDFVRTFEVNSDETYPMSININLASSTNPDIDLRVFDNA